MLSTETSFHSPSVGVLSLNQVVSEIKHFLLTDPESNYRLVIGTDSQTKKSKEDPEIDFVTAIVVHRIGTGARYFYSREKQKKYYYLREKIYTETTMSLNLASKFVPLIREQLPAANYDLEIHIDVGPIGPTRDMIKEVVGMVTGNGYKAKTKPESYGATSVADRHT